MTNEFTCPLAGMLETMTSLLNEIKSKQSPTNHQLNFTSKQAAEILGISEAELSRMRARNNGPKFHILNEVGSKPRYYYFWKDLEEWRENTTLFSNLAEVQEIRDGRRAVELQVIKERAGI
ncbi:MAG: helix-turn-helix domain-containing protein [Candidatus Omnitrophota bacterium]